MPEITVYENRDAMTDENDIRFPGVMTRPDPGDMTRPIRGETQGNVPSWTRRNAPPSQPGTQVDQNGRSSLKSKVC